MFKIYLSRTVSPGVGISLPATIEEMREAYSLLNGTDTVPLETATAYVESSIPNLRQGERMAGPELSSYKDSVWWNCEMEEADYQKIAEAVNGYLSLFQSEELVQGQQEGESHGMGVQTGKLPGNILT